MKCYQKQKFDFVDRLLLGLLQFVLKTSGPGSRADEVEHGRQRVETRTSVSHILAVEFKVNFVNFYF